MAMKGSRSTSNKKCFPTIEIGKMNTNNNPMLVGSIAKYDALLGMEFHGRNKALIHCGDTNIEFPKHKIKVRCCYEPPYCYIQQVTTSGNTSLVSFLELVDSILRSLV